MVLLLLLLLLLIWAATVVLIVCDSMWRCLETTHVASTFILSCVLLVWVWVLRAGRARVVVQVLPTRRLYLARLLLLLLLLVLVLLVVLLLLWWWQLLWITASDNALVNTTQLALLLVSLLRILVLKRLLIVAEGELAVPEIVLLSGLLRCELSLILWIHHVGMGEMIVLCWWFIFSMMMMLLLNNDLMYLEK